MAEGPEAPRNEMAADASDAVKTEDAPEGVDENDVLEEDDDFEEFEDGGTFCFLSVPVAFRYAFSRCG